MSEAGRPFLADTLVLDLAGEAGAFCSKLLADLGALVIKVETPTNDSSRARTVECGKRKGLQPVVGPRFFYQNTNKLGVTLDPASKEGRADLYALIEQADVLVETLPRARAEEIGLGPQRISHLNPALIRLSITGFGKTGPKAAYRSCDAVLSAFGGQAYLVGPPNAPPRALSGYQSDYASSLFGAVAVLLALRGRSINGCGRHIDLSGQEAVASTLDHVMVDYFRDGTISRRRGGMYGDGSFTVLPCTDGHVLLSLFNSLATIKELMISEGGTDKFAGQEWQGTSQCSTHIDRTASVVQSWTGVHTKAELFALGQTMRFPWAPVSSIEEVLESPQLAARQFFVRVPADADEKPAILPGLPYRFRFFSPPSPKAPPRPGEHNRQILGSVLRQKTRGESARAKRGRKPKKRETGVLGGVRVVDFTRMLAGPYATRILADFGAEVIKVESVKATSGEESDPFYHAAWNRNKRSIALNLDRPEARKIVMMLVSTADVVVENFSPRVMANWGFSYDELRKIKPDIIVASISAMGQTGPWRDYVGFAPTFHALSGLIFETSRGLDAPVCPNHAYGDTIVGLYAALAVLAALRRKDTTGQGEYIDLSAFEALCTLLGPAFVEAREEAAIQEETAYGCYPCLGSDRWCTIDFSEENDWEAMGKIAGLTELADGRFSSPEMRKGRRDEIDGLIASWTALHTPEQVVEILQGVGITAGAVQHAGDIAQDSQLLFRNFFVSLPHRVLGVLRSDRSALLLDDLRLKEWKAAPSAGEDNEYVLGRILGLRPEEIERYAEKGVIERERRE